MRINYQILNEKLVWMQIPKVASSLISHSLMRERKLKHPYIKMYSNDVIEFNKKIVFLTRNPYDRLISNYLNRIIKYNKLDHEELLNTSFEEFVERLVEIPHEELDIHLRPIYLFEDIMRTKNDELLWMKIEDDDTLKKLQKLGGFKLKDNVFKNITENRKDYHEYYDNNTKKLVEEYYQEDLIRYNYKY